MSLKLFKQYAASGAGSIVTARPYLDDMQKCLSGESCLNITKEMLTEAEDRFVHCDPLAAVDMGSVKSADADGWGDIAEDDIPKKSILVYDAVLATKDKDRDGDIVHPDGMQLETKMPLLWQHVWSSPIGVMVKTIEQNSDRVVNRYAIADTPLGKDAATLVSMGALRKSHGFLPVPGHFEPIEIIKTAKGDIPKGFDIKKLNVYESSLVSVPAGAKAVVLRSYEKEFDAICRAHSEKKLESPAIKSWASGLYENRTKVFGTGVDLEVGELKAIESEPTRVVVDVNVNGEKSKSCGCGTKDATNETDSGLLTFEKSAMRTEKYLGNAMPDYMPGSFEEASAAIRRQACSKIEEETGTDCYCSVVATFTDTAIVCCHTYGNGKRKCYRVSWEYKDGDPKVTGDLTEVEIEPTIVEKAFSAESWREVSAKYEKTVDTPPTPEHGLAAREQLFVQADRRRPPPLGERACGFGFLVCVARVCGGARDELCLDLRPERVLDELLILVVQQQ